MAPMSTDAGMSADGAFPMAAMPAGRLSTPAPTMLFTRLNTSLGMVAVPLPTPASDSSAAPPAPVICTATFDASGTRLADCEGSGVFCR
eukprot:scaffold229254_cov51-Attheya_sp.AAC.2